MGVMLHRQRRRCALLLPIAVALAACSQSSAGISHYFHATGRMSVDLAQAAPSEWDRVCVIGPYMADRHAEEIIGFAWPVERRTSIDRNDGITLLLFIHRNRVVQHVEHPRRQGDFAGLAGRCFNRDEAKFKRAEGRADDWPELVPAP
ncbi:hypothetical protein E2F46_16220 [Luteimonas aestuarii]|uniref:Lipoprotein n=1 Tax=Luteimonas aestuarii TaxID=453837 RepID=A0A4R5TSR4_9GAMM|nr:hypothetical protein [Luteimonas aestuarii]TDK20345.1 hypothetical protein E2F46_16220 [Luteimonas aestuarii]